MGLIFAAGYGSAFQLHSLTRRVTAPHAYRYEPVPGAQVNLVVAISYISDLLVYIPNAF